MSGAAAIPVVGVFYNEINHLTDWLQSVELQRCADVEPLPVLVFSCHPDFIGSFRELADHFLCEGRIKRENVHVLDWNVGPTVAFNIGARLFVDQAQKWPWIASLDPDARFAPAALSQMRHSAEGGDQIGMVSPLILLPRLENEFQGQVRGSETVCLAGHFPRKPNDKHVAPAPYWFSHFARKPLAQVLEFLGDRRHVAPFSACFCASLWSCRMFAEIGLPDVRQFRTLNCGEVGYRAQLNGWCGRFAPNAFAFHPDACTRDYSRSEAMKTFGSTGWHYHHAQGLISMKYFPDDIRLRASACPAVTKPWEFFFPDLAGISSLRSNSERQELYARWADFDF